MKHLQRAVAGLFAMIGIPLIVGAVHETRADPPTDHPMLRDELYSLTAQLRYGDDGADTPAPPDFIKLPVAVRLFTYAEGADTSSAVPINQQKLGFMQVAGGAISFELPEKMLSDLPQSLVIAIKPVDQQQYVAWMELPIARQTMKQIKLPLQVTVEPLRMYNITVRAIDAQDGQPVEGVEINAAPPLGGENAIMTQHANAKGEVTFGVSNAATYHFYAGQMDPDTAPATVVLARDLMVGQTTPLVIRLPKPAVVGRVHVEHEPGKRELFVGKTADVQLAESSDPSPTILSGLIGAGTLRLYQHPGPGRYEVSVTNIADEGDVYIASGHELVIEKDATFPITHDLLLKPRKPASLALTVVADNAQLPLGGVWVTLQRTGDPQARAKTDNTGVAKLPHLRTGWYAANVRAPHFIPYRKTIFIEGDAAQQISLEPTGTLRLTVKDADSKPVPRARVIVLNAAGTSERAGMTDAQGVATIHEVISKQVMLLVSTGDLRASRNSMVSDYAGSATVVGSTALTVTLGKVVNIKGTITNPPAPTGRVYFVLVQNDQRIPCSTLMLSPAGTFDTSILPGHYEVYVQAPRRPGHATEVLPVGSLDVPAEGKSDITLKMLPDAKPTTLTRLMRGDKR